MVTAFGGAAAVLLGAWFALEARFASANDFNRAVKEMRIEMQANRAQQEIQWLDMRKSGVQDKLYDLKSKGMLKPHEQGSVMRYEAELNKLDRDIRDKQRALDASRVIK